MEPLTQNLTQREIVKLGAIVSAYRELWSLEADVAERLADAKKAMGSIWVIASGLGGFAAIRIGQQHDDNWLVVMGAVILYFVVSQTFRAWAAERDVRHEFEDVRRRLWDMKNKWLYLGGTEDHLGALYSIWAIDPGFESESFKDGWSKIKADIAKRLEAPDQMTES